MGWRIVHGDCVERMAAMAEASVDAVVCDPPYLLTFMGRTWDHAPTPAEGQAMHLRWARQALRVLKPGGHLLAFGGTRTYHRLACAVEDAGFEIRDSFLYWGYGSGFPKSLSPYRSIMGGLCPSHGSAKHAVRISSRTQVPSSEAKGDSAPALVEILPGGDLGLLIPTGAVDGFSAAMVIGPCALKTVGMNLSIGPSWRGSLVEGLNGGSTSIIETATRAITDPRILNFCRSLTTPPTTTPDEWRPDGCSCHVLPVVESSSDGGWRWSDTPLLIAPGTAIGPLAPLEGLGTAAKPSYEPIVVARKPLGGTVAGNVLEFGTGAINVDACRINGVPPSVPQPVLGEAKRTYGFGTGEGRNGEMSEASGRWPANVCFDEEAAAALDEQTGELHTHAGTYRRVADEAHDTRVVYGKYAAMDAGTTVSNGDSGGASRFFYVAKASSAERNAGLDGFEARSPVYNGQSAEPAGCAPGSVEDKFSTAPRQNVHPTVKPIELMRWLVRLVTPPGGTVLDPFTGSGTTGCAAVLEGFDFVGIEREAEYAEIAEARIRWWAEHPDGMQLVRRLEFEQERKAMADAGQMGLFG